MGFRYTEKRILYLPLPFIFSLPEIRMDSYFDQNLNFNKIDLTSFLQGVICIWDSYSCPNDEAVRVQWLNDSISKWSSCKKCSIKGEKQP